MLVLTRKKDEAVRIGDDIVIRIIATDRNSVRIGIEAPPQVSILREELVRAVSEENIRAVGEAPAELLRSLKEKISRS